MAPIKSCTSFVLVLMSMLNTIDISSAKPAPASHKNLLPCVGMGKDARTEIVSDIEVHEAKLWSSMKNIVVHDLNNAVDQISKKENHLQCETSSKVHTFQTLHKLKDYSSIKGLREASLTVYGDLLNLVAHLNVVVDNQGCWDDNMKTQFKKLRNIMHPVLCDINGLLEAEVQALLGEIIALKIVSLGKEECSLTNTVTCTLLTHIGHFAKGLKQFNIPS